MISQSIGKVRGLRATSTAAGVFSVLAFDHRQSFARMLPTVDGQTAPYSEVVSAKRAVVEALAPCSSAVLLDPVYGAAQTVASGALPRESGLIVAVEETGYTGSDYARQTELLPDWSVEKIKRMGADAVKLLIYYHPDAGEIARQQEALTERIIAECQQADILLFLEVICHSADPDIKKESAEFAAQRPALIARIAEQLSAFNPDVLKIEFPVDIRHDADVRHWTAACEAVSVRSSRPWTLLSAAVNFETFQQQVEIACRAGASGYIGGRAIWQEGVSMSPAERDRWLHEVAARRMETLATLADQTARPWTDFTDGLANSISEDWYRAYPA